MEEGVLWARAPRRLRPWRRHIREGLELAAAEGDWSPAELYPAADCANTRFSLGGAEMALLENLERGSGQPRWVILTAALHWLQESGQHALPERVAMPLPGVRTVTSALLPAALKPFRSELEQGLQMIETGADWNAASAYDKAGFTITRIVMSAETAIRVEDLAASRDVSKTAVLIVALHALSQATGFVKQRAPDSAIARRWRPPSGSVPEGGRQLPVSGRGRPGAGTG